LRSRINKEYVKKSEGVVEVFLELGKEVWWRGG